MMTRRMFSPDVVENDSFIDMSFDAQLLYFHLSMYADNEGFVSNPKTVIRTIGADKECLNELINSNFVISFDSGIVVITHWKKNNYLDEKRMKKTTFIDEKKLLIVKNRCYFRVDHDTKLMNSKELHVTPKNSNKFHASIVENSIVENKKTNETIPFQKIVDIYNSTCIKLPKVVRLTDNRKKAIKARYMEYEKDISIFETLFKKVNESDFLQGINGEWKANFDWLLKQQSMVKVLEDQYINKHNQKNKESELVKNAIFGQNS
ncbi:hypothetical protein [Thomasclavelia cocleata]|uniref:hypothetical protein n=1 Tax=Thomasclavelia cocleata TaxID=69824 RepID=UPI00255A9225|nr:hypothetical protein [Thomasclavelia cocleata]